MAARVYPLALMMVGVAFIFLGFMRYPAFVGVAGLYLFIGARGLVRASHGEAEAAKHQVSDKTQLESL